tara:strand:- start:16 stop:123 length:108 start_codon:yes stop_codon:yes gene_type:complete
MKNKTKKGKGRISKRNCNNPEKRHYKINKRKKENK